MARAYIRSGSYLRTSHRVIQSISLVAWNTSLKNHVKELENENKIIIIIIIVTFITRTNSQNVSWAIQRRVVETVEQWHKHSCTNKLKEKLQQIVKCLPKQVRFQSSLESIKRGGKSKRRRQSVPHSRSCHSKRAPSQFISYTACLQQWRTEPGAQSSCRFIIGQQGAQVSRQQTNPSLIS